MITCGRCGKEVPLVRKCGSTFRILETFECDDGQKYISTSSLCDKCHNELVACLYEGRYKKNHSPALPVRNNMKEKRELQEQIDELRILLDKVYDNIFYA